MNFPWVWSMRGITFNNQSTHTWSISAEKKTHPKKTAPSEKRSLPWRQAVVKQMDFSRFLKAAKAFFIAAWLGWWLKIPRLEFGDLVPPLSTEEFLRDHWGRHLGLEQDGFAAGMSPLRLLEVDVLFFFVDGYQWCFGACLASPRKPFATSLGEDWCDNDLHLDHLWSLECCHRVADMLATKNL